MKLEASSQEGMMGPLGLGFGGLRKDRPGGSGFRVRV